MKRKIPIFILCAALACSLLPVSALAASPYPDVDENAWYGAYVERCTAEGILNGFEDGTFRPDATLRRGEFIKILACAGGLTYSGSLAGVHWAEQYWCALNAAGVMQGVDIECSAAGLQQVITRYEMAELIANFLTQVLRERPAAVSGAADHIPDYASIPEDCRTAVEQVYGKGIINGLVNTPGVADGSFCGGDSLTRAQGVAVTIRLTDSSARTYASFVERDDNPYRLEDAPNGSTPFAVWARNSGLIDEYGGATAEFNQLFFGAADKTYFTSDADAAPWMTKITVNVWTITGGVKKASTLELTVHKYLAADVYDIFQQIFEDPEQFPIYSAGAARFTDKLRHAWGAAVDINYDYNCECNTRSGTLKVTCGRGWWPVGLAASDFAGTLTAASPYSLSAAGSVVKAFADYGWGWGGSWTGTSRDFMHFSLLSSGG